MASFYSTSCGEADMLPSYPSSELAADNNRLYLNQPSSVSLTYSNFFSNHHQLSEPENRDEMVFIPPTRMQLVDRQHDMMPRYSDGNTVISEESIPQYQGLSLSLGSQLHSDLNHYTNSSLCSFDLQSELQENALKNVHYLSFDLAGKAPQDSIKYETSGNFHNPIASNQASEFTGTFCNSKYLKAAQDLLDELVSVHRSPKLNEKSLEVKPDADSATEPSRDISPSERHDLQNKLTKLFSMLDEVDRRYKQYWHQMQAVVSSFDMVAGRGAALPYTALALRTISRQFRCIRDAIKKQIQVIQRSLGDQDVNSHGLGVFSRLRYVDQHLRQQKAFQQFGIMRQPWRPQRGLPENAVSVLRAWLFEHFLHPYPKDSEKIVLARETGLTRSQVANWFINARVRLWKPMIEEMYKEEFGEAETEPRSSPQQPTTQEISAYDETEEDFHVSLMSADNNQIQSNESRPDATSRAEIDASRARAGLAYENRVFQGMEANFESNKHIVNAGGNRKFFSNNSKTADENIMGDQVSLALGLQHSEMDFSGIQTKGNEGASSSSVVLDKLEYYYVDPVNNESRFGNTAHLMSDFVA